MSIFEPCFRHFRQKFLKQGFKIARSHDKKFNSESFQLQKGVDSHPKPIKAVFLTQSPSLVSDVTRCFWHGNCLPDFSFQSIAFLDEKQSFKNIW